MARRLKLPIARVLSEEDAPTIDAIVAEANTRILLVDLVALRLTKTYATLRKQAGEWSDKEVEDWLLGQMAQGPV